MFVTIAAMVTGESEVTSLGVMVRFVTLKLAGFGGSRAVFRCEGVVESVGRIVALGSGEGTAVVAHDVTKRQNTRKALIDGIIFLLITASIVLPETALVR